MRELHVYGSSLPLETINSDEQYTFQHKGYGKKLLKWAEEMSAKEGYSKIAVISGVGVREYYRKFGYVLKDGYMVKDIL